jgi:hypothetical protein
MTIPEFIGSGILWGIIWTLFYIGVDIVKDWKDENK